jgi:hypothetical protein
VTTGFLRILTELAAAADRGNPEDLFRLEQHPLLSANHCEALLMVRPEGERSVLAVSSTWSKALPLPEGYHPQTTVTLRQECFEAAEYLAPRLRAKVESKPALFVGFVEVLRGQSASPDGRPEGEVHFSIILEDGETIRARAYLKTDDYARAGASHLEGEPVSFKGILTRLPRLSRIEQVSEFSRIAP